MKTVEQIIEKIESEIRKKEELLKKMDSGEKYWSIDEYEIIQGLIDAKTMLLTASLYQIWHYWIKGS